jgi:hypothetical protein
LIPGRGRDISFFHNVQTGSWALSASYLTGTGGFSLGVNQPGRETDHSPSSSVKVKNAWSCVSTLPYTFMMWCVRYKTMIFVFPIHDIPFVLSIILSRGFMNKYGISVVGKGKVVPVLN